MEHARHNSKHRSNYKKASSVGSQTDKKALAPGID